MARNRDATATGLPGEVIEALRAGNKIEAIKRLRLATGLGLKEAKELVDGLHPDDLEAGTASTAARGSATENVPPQVMELMRAGRKLDAIKTLRDATGLGLKEAKEWVESRQAQLQGGAQQTVQRGGGGARTALMIVVVAALALAAWLGSGD